MRTGTFPIFMGFIIACVMLMAGPKPAIPQFTGSALPISYYYSNPLYFTGFGYINSIIEPFYYLGYGYKPPIEGNTLLAWNRYSPFSDPYSAYLLNFFGIPVHPYFGSPYQTAFPYRTLPGTGYPYERFSYPSYSFGSSGIYQVWVALQ